MTFAIGTFAVDGTAFPGLVVGDRVYPIADLIPGLPSTGALLSDWATNFTILNSAVSADAALRSARSWGLDEVATLPPVQPLGQLFAAGANYREHVIQMTVANRLGKDGATDDELREEAGREIDERARTGQPYAFTGVSSSICGAFDDVILPEVGTDHDWEIELGAIIGREARNVPVTDAMDYVAGYTICNDLTTRSLVQRKDIPMMGTDWLRSKNQPTFYPTGPYLVPAAFVNPRDLTLTLRLNGTTMQNGPTEDMIFDVAALVAYISTLVTLKPGDMIITGSPAGNGSHWGRFLQSGDVMEAEITGLGLQRNLVR